MYRIPGWRIRIFNSSLSQWIGNPTVSRVAGGLKAGYGMTAAESGQVMLLFSLRPLPRRFSQTGREPEAG
jgi:hypothetical protein